MTADSNPTLPEMPVLRWTPRIKQTIVLAVGVGKISREEALRLYQMSEEELARWQELNSSQGRRGLRASYIQNYR